MLTFILIWLFMGSFGLNLMWAAKVRSNKTIKTGYKLFDACKGILLGFILGPLTILVGIYRLLRKDKS